MLKHIVHIFILIFAFQNLNAQQLATESYDNSKPWVYWYWMHSAYSKEGITADLEAMKKVGIHGAYLMSVKGPTDPPLMDPPILQLSEQWWELVDFAIAEADRLGLKIAMHAADGFAVAGGPWIKPEQSMQKLVWTDRLVQGGNQLRISLEQPETIENYYKDIAVFAIARKNLPVTSATIKPIVTTSLDTIEASFLADSKQVDEFKLYEKGWVQYEFSEPFLCKSITIASKGVNYQAQRLRVLVSDDGENFKDLGRLTPPRHGWQDWGIDYTHSIKATKSKYFRFVFDPIGSEPGAEDLDAAKWKQSLKVTNIVLSSEAKIDNFQGKSGKVWRISPQTNGIAEEDFISLDAVLNITEHMDQNGMLNWKAPEGIWKIMRFGHTSTGQKNETGGGGKGLEVDKFDPELVKYQFQKWFGKSVEIAGEERVPEVLSILHIDSWEAGSQNWSSVFQSEFKNRRGYDIVDYLPVMAGIPIESVQTSEQILRDVRKTISELIVDNFFGTMSEEAGKLGIKFSSENVSPTMVSDALMHFKYVDFPGGEFWFRSPTHDKPNDMLDAISGAHIYDKNIVQAEAFTGLRMEWDEDPELLKAMADRNYALGINRFFYHVFVHNPWLDRKPGMTLDGIGTYFQRDQTWWEPAEAWVEYCRRVQFQLQRGDPVIDLAVFTGEELPSRSVLPDRLLPFLPHVFGNKRIASEKERLKNYGLPIARMPKEVQYSKNMTDLNHWINSLNGYKYDSFNRDVLLEHAKVVNGSIEFKGKISYKALIFPGSRKMSPTVMVSTKVAQKMLDLIKEGATVFVAEKPSHQPGFSLEPAKEHWQQIIDQIWKGYNPKATPDTFNSWNIGKGKVIQLPYLLENFKAIGIEPDILFPELSREQAENFAWTHRTLGDEEVYFISNQSKLGQLVNVSLRTSDKKPFLYNPVTDTYVAIQQWQVKNQRLEIPLKFHKNESLFIILKGELGELSGNLGENWTSYTTKKVLDEHWQLQFDPNYNGLNEAIEIDSLFNWSDHNDAKIKYYSGTACYSKTFNYKGSTKDVWLNLGDFSDIAEIFLNDKRVGVVWTFPHRINITGFLERGKNNLMIKITNTWRNRLIGDHKLSQEKRTTWTTAPYRLHSEELLPAGLIGPVRLEKAK